MTNLELDRYIKALYDYNDPNCKFLNYGFCLYFFQAQNLPVAKNFEGILPTLWSLKPINTVKVWYEPGKRFDEYWFKPGDIKNRIILLEQAISIL
jgi:hypothetical protein